MNYMHQKVSFLKGLAEGLDIEETSKEGKLLLYMIDAFEDFADEFDEMVDKYEELEEYVSCIDEDLTDMEEEIFEFDDDYDDYIDYVDDDCDECMEIECPDYDEELEESMDDEDY